MIFLIGIEKDILKCRKSLLNPANVLKNSVLIIEGIISQW